MAKTSSNPIAVRASRSTAEIAGHVANITNPHSVTKAQVGLSNADNTSDLSKPISTATQLSLDDKLEAADIATKLDANGYNGSVTVVDSVDFVGQTVTTKTISYVDGQITSVV